MVFGGGILGGARKILGNPYLNSTTVLFDTAFSILYILPVTVKPHPFTLNSVRDLLHWSARDINVIPSSPIWLKLKINTLNDA